MLTNCYPPSGTVGLAYVGVTCTSYGTGWSNFLSSPGSWEVAAHEIGHNFGATHTFSSGGIMSYDGKKEYHFTSQNPTEVILMHFYLSIIPFRSVHMCPHLSPNVTHPIRLPVVMEF